MKTPPFLTTGSMIGILSPARKIEKNELEPALKILTDWGLTYTLGKTIGASEDQFAGNDKIRIEDFQQMLDDPNIKAIWCARGGYGSVRLIDHLDFSAFRENPKWIIGYSDITVLHSHIHKFGVETLHAQMPLEIEKKSPQTTSTLKQALFGKSLTINYSPENNMGRKGMAEGTLIGGNLSVLYSLCGSRSSLYTRNKILFIEDLDEYLYHIDRMMQNLNRNGMLDQLSGLIVGGMSKMNDNNIPFGKDAEAIINDIVSEYNYPVCFNFPAGHTADNRALILGRKVKLNVQEDSVTLQF